MPARPRPLESTAPAPAPRVHCARLPRRARGREGPVWSEFGDPDQERRHRGWGEGWVKAGDTHPTPRRGRAPPDTRGADVAGDQERRVARCHGPAGGARSPGRCRVHVVTGWPRCPRPSSTPPRELGLQSAGPIATRESICHPAPACHRCAAAACCQGPSRAERHLRAGLRGQTVPVPACPCQVTCLTRTATYPARSCRTRTLHVLTAQDVHRAHAPHTRSPGSSRHLQAPWWQVWAHGGRSGPLPGRLPPCGAPARPQPRPRHMRGHLLAVRASPEVPNCVTAGDIETHSTERGPLSTVPPSGGGASAARRRVPSTPSGGDERTRPFHAEGLSPAQERNPSPRRHKSAFWRSRSSRLRGNPPGPAPPPVRPAPWTGPPAPLPRTPGLSLAPA